MKKLTLSQRTKIVQFYFENNHSIIRTQRPYRRQFNVRNDYTQHYLPRSGKPRSIFTNANVQTRTESVEEELGTLIRSRSSQLELSRMSLRNILRHLRLFPIRSRLFRIYNHEIPAWYPRFNGAWLLFSLKGKMYRRKILNPSRK